MRKINFGIVLDNRHLQFEFSNEESRVLDLESIKHYPVFDFLKDDKNIGKFVITGGHIEWTEFEADISADTIWHLSVPKTV
jgi:hypothetical protein